MDTNLFAIGASCLSLLVAGISLGWNIYSNMIDCPRLKVNAYISDCLKDDRIEKGRGEPPTALGHSTGRCPTNRASFLGMF